MEADETPEQDDEEFLNAIQKALATAVQEFMDDAGVETYVVLLRDPDSNELVTAHQGDTVWRMGALRAAAIALDSEVLD